MEEAFYALKLFDVIIYNKKS